MLAVIRDKRGQIDAACEWHLVEPVWRDGQLDTAFRADGRYVWIEQFELSHGASMSACARSLIEQIATRCPWTVAVYWVRRDKPTFEPVKLQFSRKAVLRYAQQGVVV